MALLLTAMAGSHSQLGWFHSLRYSGSQLRFRQSYARIAAILLRDGLLPAAIMAVSISDWLYSVVVVKLSAGIRMYHEPKRDS